MGSMTGEAGDLAKGDFEVFCMYHFAALVDQSRIVLVTYLLS
jgi:hypothetical protein